MHQEWKNGPSLVKVYNGKTNKLRLKLHSFEKDWRKWLVYKQTVALNE